MEVCLSDMINVGTDHLNFSYPTIRVGT